MVYASIADMVERFGERELTQLSDRDDAGAIDNSVLTRALDDATAFINGFVGRVYQLPLQGCAKPLAVPGGEVEYVAPPVLKRMACDLARYYLYTDVGEDHEAARRYKAAAGDLKAIAEGKVQLTCPWGGPPGTALHGDNLQGHEVFHSFAPRAINDDSLRGFA